VVGDAPFFCATPPPPPRTMHRTLSGICLFGWGLRPTRLLADGGLVLADGSIKLPDGTLQLADGTFVVCVWGPRWAVRALQRHRSASPRPHSPQPLRVVGLRDSMSLSLSLLALCCSSRGLWEEHLFRPLKSREFSGGGSCSCWD